MCPHRASRNRGRSHPESALNRASRKITRRMTIIAAAKSHKIFAARDSVVRRNNGYARYGQSQYRCKLNSPSHLVTLPSELVCRPIQEVPSGSTITWGHRAATSSVNVPRLHVETRPVSTRRRLPNRKHQLLMGQAAAVWRGSCAALR